MVRKLKPINGKKRIARKRYPQEESEPVQEPIGILDFFNRRNAFIALGILGLAIAADDFSCLDSQEKEFADIVQNKRPAVQKVLKEAEVAPRIAEHNEWASKIQIPTFQAKEESIVSTSMDLKKLSHYVVDEDMDSEQVNEYYRVFDREKNKLIKKLKVKNRRSKLKLVEQFISILVDNYPDSERKHIIENLIKNGDRNSYVKILAELLIPHGHWFDFYFTVDLPEFEITVFTFALCKVEKIQNIMINSAEFDLDIPVVFIKKENIPSLEEEMQEIGQGGLHYQNFITLNKDAVYRGIKSFLSLAKKAGVTINQETLENIAQKIIDLIIAHEIGHEIVQQTSSSKIRNDHISSIDMKHYVLPDRIFEEIEPSFFHQMLGELAADGYALLHAKSVESVLIYLGTTHRDFFLEPKFKQSTTQYDLIKIILQYEITHSPYLESDLRETFSENWREDRSSIKTKSDAIKKIPLKEWHRIGERMYKLAIGLSG